MKKLKNLKKNKKGFTLIEMIVVIVIIAILAAIAVPAVMKYIDEARETKLITAAGSAKTSLEAELTKYQAKSADNKISTDEMNAANAVAVKDVENVTVSKVCTNLERGEGANINVYTCTAPTTDFSLADVKGYQFTVDSRIVTVENNGAAEIQPK